MAKRGKKKKWSPLSGLFKKSSKEKKPEVTWYEESDETADSGFEQNSSQNEEGFVIEESDETVLEIEESTTDVFIPETAIKEFTVLGLEDNASLAEIKKKYRELAKEHHPDNGGDPKEFMKLQKAYKKILRYHGKAGGR
jgi:DnaJ-domain-containing protein 1